MTNNAQITLLTTKTPKVLTKQVHLSKEGRMVKVPSAQLTRGEAEVVSITCIEEFAELLQGLADSQALVYGVPMHGLTHAKVVTKKDLESLDGSPGVIARSNDHFEWPAAPGIMMLDYDPEGEALDRETVLELLYNACPAIKDVDHLWWMSSSSNISNIETGEQISGVSGQRIYFIVDDARDIPRAAKVLGEKLWLAGHGHIKISASGAMLERVPFDMSVYQPSRLDFAAGASCVAPLAQDRGAPVLLKGTASNLNTTAALPSLKDSLQEKLEELKAGKEVVARPKADEARLEYARRMKKKLKTYEFGESDEEILAEIDRILYKGELPSYWMLHVWNGSELIDLTVQDVLRNKQAFDGMLCLDPIEPEYDECRLVGKLYLNQHNPRVFSFARGQRSLTLKEFKHVILVESELHNAVNETLEILEKRKDAFNYGGVLVTPINKTLNYLDHPKMKHLLGGFIQYWSLAKPCNPTNELVDGVCSIGVARNLNPITGFVDHPVIDSKLRMLLKPGYNQQMKMLGDFDHKDFDVKDQQLTDREVMFHWNRVLAPFTAFELGDDDDRTVLMAAIFSAVLRQALTTCPVFGFDAPIQGSGKSLLAETIGIIASGKAPSAIPPASGKFDDEFRKGLTAILLRGDKVINFDNIVGTFDSASFAAAITSEFFEGRYLGKSKMIKVRNKTLFLMTGNNLQLVGDMSRRVLKARLIPKSNKLAMRKYDFDPRERALETRSEIISSVLSLINHWKHCGHEKLPGTMTSFSEWDLLVRQPLAFIGQQFPETGMVDVLDVSLKQQNDSSDKDALINLLKEAAIHFGVGILFKGGAAFKAFKDMARFEDAVLAFKSREELRSSQHMGNLLKQFKDRDVEGLVLRCKQISGSWSYWVELTDDTHRQEIEKHTCSLDADSMKRSSKVRLIK
ncbi:hypothetical protein XMD543_000598 [Marinobacterium sp. xm-d-543]|uniref:hypothetical protein n=1 Tax=Marinobacterium sp. xm-d-543 TaxID=2497740 RepID=UPI001568B1FC|nr:hypothetical protein [Marinobacterium sp. xm-d-543]NRP46573.1 hypothetical protein [Marinobacterium sp. xm-d-543]